MKTNGEQKIISDFLHLNGVIDGCIEDLEMLEFFWPKSKRGSKAQFYLTSLKSRIDGAKQVCCDLKLDADKFNLIRGE